MLMTFDFKCDQCGHVQEELVPSNQRAYTCELCGSNSTRQIAAVRSKLDGTDPGFPDAYDKWARDHEKAGKGQP